MIAVEPYSGRPVTEQRVEIVIAREIHEEIEGVREVSVFLLSRIGTPIGWPQVATAQVLPARGRSIGDISPNAKSIIERELSSIDTFCRDLSRGAYLVC